MPLSAGLLDPGSSHPVRDFPNHTRLGRRRTTSNILNFQKTKASGSPKFWQADLQCSANAPTRIILFMANMTPIDKTRSLGSQIKTLWHRTSLGGSKGLWWFMMVNDCLFHDLFFIRTCWCWFCLSLWLIISRTWVITSVVPPPPPLPLLLLVITATWSMAFILSPFKRFSSLTVLHMYGPPESSQCCQQPLTCHGPSMTLIRLHSLQRYD